MYGKKTVTKIVYGKNMNYLAFSVFLPVLQQFRI